MQPKFNLKIQVKANKTSNAQQELPWADMEKMPENVQISISRDKTYPTASEWKTVLANFPYSVPQVAMTSFIDSDRRFAMRAKLPRRKDVPQQLDFGTQSTAISEPENEVADSSQDAVV